MYVVNFISLYCGTCVLDVPPLNRIAKKKYADQKVRVVSVYDHYLTDPNGDVSVSLEMYVAGVERRVNDLGDQMDFAVTIDVPERQTHIDRGGVDHTSFIVDKEGRVAWEVHDFFTDTEYEDILADGMGVTTREPSARAHTMR